MTFKQPDLPFALSDLTPWVSEEQMDYHFNKHHAGYYKKLNGLVDGKPESELSLRDLVVQSKGGVFNNAGQAWNHAFFWSCLSPSGGGKPSSEVMQAIVRDFGSYDAFCQAFSDAAAALFGSGWAWLASDAQGKLEIMPLSNADTPLKYGKEPILTLDVWEHAYYIDYRNRRPDFIEGFWDVVNWQFANDMYSQLKK